MKTIDKICNYCKEIFTAQLREHNRGNALFCSKPCAHKGRARPKKEPNVTCAYCNKQFYKNFSKQKLSKSGLYFCCRDHKDQGQQISSNIPEIQPKGYKDGSYIDYRKIAYRNHPKKCAACGYNEQPEILVVHHIDHNRSNNDISNLEILCPNCHDTYHYLTQSGRFSHLRTA